MADKEVLFRFSSEGLQEILQQLSQVTQSLQGGLQGGGTSSNPGSSSPVSVTSKGPYAPTAQQGSTTAAAAMNAASPSPMPVATGNVYTAPPGTPAQPASPYKQPSVPVVAAPGTGAATGGGAYFNGSTYELRNDAGRVMLSGMGREDAINSAKFLGNPARIMNEAQAAAQASVPTQRFYSASGMNMSVGGQVVAQGIPGIATPTSIAQQAMGLNQSVMGGGIPVPQAIPPEAMVGPGVMPGYLRGMLGMPMIGMSSAMGGYFLGTAAVAEAGQLGRAYGGYYGRAAAGHTVYPQERTMATMGSAFTIGGAIGGAIAGSFLGNPVIGAMAGMGLGNVIGSAYQSYWTPGLEAEIEKTKIAELDLTFGRGLSRNYDLGHANIRRALTDMIPRGLMMSSGIAANLGTNGAWGTENLGNVMIPAMIQGQFNPSVFGRFGYGVDRNSVKAGGIAAVMSGDYGNPLVSNQGLGKFAASMGNLRYTGGIMQEQLSASKIGYQTESQFAGYTSSASEFKEVSHGQSFVLNNLKEQAKQMEKAGATAEPEYYRVKTQIASIQSEKRQTAYQREMLRFGESESRFGLRTQRASQAFEYERATGTQPEDLPWQRQSDTFTAHAGAIRGEMSRLRSKKLLSPMQEYQMTQEAESEEYRAKMIPLQKMSATWDIREARGSRYIAQTHAANVGLSMLGGPNERYEAAQRDIEANQMLLDLEQKRLNNDKSLTAEKREQLGTTIANLQASQTAAKIEAQRAKVQGIYSMASSDVEITRAGISQQYAKGAGGAAATALITSGLGATATQMGAIQKVIDDPSTDPITRKQMQAQQAGMWTQYYQQIGEAGAPPMSAKQRTGMSNVQTALGIATTTFAQQADIRGLLESQMKQIGGRIGDLGRNRASLMKEGKWTDESEARYSEERNSWLMQAAGAQHQLEEGWLDRLVSQTWNAPGSFTMIASQFTRREASLFAGITSRAFGGGKEQSDYWRRQYPARYTSMIGKVGTQEGFMETGMAKGTAGGSVNGTVTVRVEVGENGKLVKTQNQVLQIQSSTPNFDKINPTQHNANTRGNYQ